MKKLKIVVPLSFIAMAFTGCHDINGRMKVFAPFSIQNHHIQSKTVSFVPGTYDTEITLHEHQGLIEVKADGHSNVKFKIPQSYLENEGKIEIQGSDVREPFNIKGDRRTEVTNSQSEPGTQSCVLRYETRIDYELVPGVTCPPYLPYDPGYYPGYGYGYPGYGRPYHRTPYPGGICYPTGPTYIPVERQVPIYGTQNILQHVRTTRHVFELNFVDLDNGSTLATFDASDASAYFVVDAVTSSCL